MDFDMIAQILAVVFGILTLYFGAQFACARKILAEAAEALATTSSFINTDNPTADDVRALTAEWSDVIDAVRSFTSFHR